MHPFKQESFMSEFSYFSWRIKDVAPSHPQQIPFSSLQQVELLICPSSQGDLPASNQPAAEIEP
jgi:hypothetical protein